MSIKQRTNARFFSGTHAEFTALTVKKFYERDFIFVTDRNFFRIGTKAGALFASCPQIGSPLFGKTNALNATGTITATMINEKVITSTSAAAVTATLATAAVLVAAFPAVLGEEREFIIDNTAGANTVTVAIADGITVATAVLTGADTLTVAAGKVGKFLLYFTSTTTAILSRVQ